MSDVTAAIPLGILSSRDRLPDAERARYEEQINRHKRSLDLAVEEIRQLKQELTKAQEDRTGRSRMHDERHRQELMRYEDQAEKLRTERDTALQGVDRLTTLLQEVGNPDKLEALVGRVASLTIQVDERDREIEVLKHRAGGLERLADAARKDYAYLRGNPTLPNDLTGALMGLREALNRLDFTGRGLPTLVLTGREGEAQRGIRRALGQEREIVRQEPGEPDPDDPGLEID